MINKHWFQRKNLQSPVSITLVLFASLSFFRSWKKMSFRSSCIQPSAFSVLFCLNLYLILCISQFQRCPSPPGQPWGICFVVSPGGGAFAILSRPRGWALAYPGDDPRAFDTRVFERQVSLSGRTRPLSKTGLSHQELEKFRCF